MGLLVTAESGYITNIQWLFNTLRHMGFNVSNPVNLWVNYINR